MLVRLCRRGELAKVCQHLDSNPEDLEVPDSSSSRPLHMAAECGHLNVVAELIERGAIVDSEKMDRATPLYLGEVFVT